ncbi:Voltage gated chloride channel [Sphingobacterium daejeonense]|nr:chloride channel protein [Sphingobacterium daejeonense]VTP95651.1 Voltage gated chloride channel [Sphingobacterium daejeonense]
MIAFLPVAGLLIGLLYHYYGRNVEAGNNLLIDNIHNPKEIIPLRMAPFVYLGTIVTHLFGGSAGREGTAIQMAGSIADQFSKPFRLSSSDRKILLIAASREDLVLSLVLRWQGQFLEWNSFYWAE